MLLYCKDAQYLISTQNERLKRGRDQKGLRLKRAAMIEIFHGLEGVDLRVKEAVKEILRVRWLSRGGYIGLQSATEGHDSKKARTKWEYIREKLKFI